MCQLTIIYFRKCIAAKNYSHYKCLQYEIEQRIKNDLKCNIPVLVHNKFNKDLAMCNTTQDFEIGNNNRKLFLYFYLDKVENYFLVCIARHQMDRIILPEEMRRNENCKPMCDIWSYEVAKVGTVSHTGRR